MPIPPGARQVPGNPNRIRLADGSIVTRSKARTLGAQLEGFKNENDRRHNADKQQSNIKYFKAWSKSKTGKDAIAQAKAQAKAEGRPYRESEIRTELLAARESRPRVSEGMTSPDNGAAWFSFGEKYGIFGPIVDYTRY